MDISFITKKTKNIKLDNKFDSLTVQSDSEEETVKPVVVQNADELYKSDIQWVEPREPEPINDYEINMLKNTKNPFQLLEDEIIETKPELTEKQKRRQYITMIKVVALDSMGKNCMSNPSYFSKKEKDKLIKLMEEFMEKPEEEIKPLFNEIVSEKLFHPSADYSNYPVYDI
jgi:UTP-glucose-1-phosphate uridylyltransferase